MRLYELFIPDNQHQLLEYNRDATLKNYGGKVVTVARKDRSIPQQFRSTEVSDDQLLDLVMTQIEGSDPTRNKEYSQALTKIYTNGQTAFEDMGSTVADYLTKFDKLKRKKKIPAPRNDFMRYANIGDFLSVVDEYPNPDEEELTDKGSSDEIYKDATVRVLRPNNKEAACYYGQGTKWCTAAKSNNLFDTYASKGELYIIIPTKPEYAGEKYQFHFQSHQFMDEQDQNADLFVIINKFPQLKKLFHDQAIKNSEVAFFMSRQELEKKLPKVIQSIYTGLKNEYKVQSRAMANDAAKDLKAYIDKGIAREAADEFFEQLQEPDGVAELLFSVIRQLQQDYHTGLDEDEWFDNTLDVFQDWVTEHSNAYLLITDFYEEDDQIFMDTNFSLAGIMQSVATKYVMENFRKLLLQGTI